MTQIVHEYNVFSKTNFEHELNKIVNRYNAKVEVTWGEPYEVEVYFANYEREIKFKTNKFPVTVAFDFDQYKVEGFTYLGCIQDEMMMGLITVHGNELVEEDASAEIVDYVKHFENIPCHNCGRKHRRKYGHMFRVDETGELIVFGSSCAKNYFGIDFDRLLRFFERLNITFGGDWEEDYIGERFSKIIEWKYAAKMAYYQIKKYGYLSGAKAREQDGRASTADITRAMYIDDDNVMTDAVKAEIREMHEKGEFPEFDILAEVDFLNGKTENLNDFEYNLTILQEKMRQDVVTFHSYGFLAYLVYKHFFHTEEPRPEKKEYIIPEWAVKGRRFKKDEQPFECEVSHMHSFNGSFGLTTIITLVSGDVRFKWFATADQNIEIGDKVVLNSFTVKNIEDNQYGKSVMINRARLEVPGTGKPTNGRERAPRASNSVAQGPTKADKEYFDQLGIPTNAVWSA